MASSSNQTFGSTTQSQEASKRASELDPVAARGQPAATAERNKSQVDAILRARGQLDARQGANAAPVSGGRNAPDNAAVQDKPNSTGTNTVDIVTDDFTIIVDGHQVTGDNDPVPDAPGNIRYVNVGGVGDCYCFAYHGTRRSDGRPVTLVAHISSKQYMKGEQNNRVPGRVSTFLRSVANVRAIGVTNYDHDKDMSQPSSTKMVLMPNGIRMHNTQYPRDKKAVEGKGAYTTYIVDTSAFDVHGSGERVSGEAAVTESVSAFMTEGERVAERNKGCCVIL